MNDFIRIENVTKHFPIKGGLFSRQVGAVKAVQDVSISIKKGETLGLVGESGCGKSTLLNMLGCLDRPDRGSCRLDGEDVADWPVRRLEHKWAGLRSFAPDRLPVYGFDPATPGFFWFAGQGGFGIQTAPAAADLAAALLLGRQGGTVDPAPYSPARFH